MPEDGGYINGIFTDGAKWDADHKYLVDSEFGVLYSNMTIIHLMPVEILKKKSMHC